MVLKASHFFSLSSSSPIPHQQNIITWPPQLGGCRSKFSRLADATSTMAIIGTKQECRHQLVHRNAANACTNYMTQDTMFKIVCKTGSSKNTKQPAVCCECIYSMVNSCRLNLYHTAGVHRELRDQFITANNWKPTWPSKAFLRTVCEIEHHDVVSSGILAHDFPDKHPCKWTGQALITLEEATEVYMVQVIAESHC